MYKTYNLTIIFQVVFFILSLKILTLNYCFSSEFNNEGFELSITDNPIELYQTKLLNLAIGTATAIPTDPHIKDRSKTQQEVVLTCLKLDQPNLALTYIDKIENWRRGACYADLAYYCAQNNAIEEAQHFIKLAEVVVNTAEDWRKDNINVRIAQVLTLLDKDKQAKKLDTDVVPSEQGKVEQTKALLNNESFDEQFKSIDKLLEYQNFDITNNSLQAFTILYGQYYDNSEKRLLIEKKIKSNWQPMPILIRFELLNKLAQHSLDNSDNLKALQLINEAQLFINNFNWPLEHQISMMALLIKLRFNAGDQDKARIDADAALHLYDEQRGKIVDIWRAGALRPLAEAYKSIGDEQTALMVYKQAIEEGVENPNSRPRAEDLSATLCSMALNSVEPDKELWTRINQIKNGLDHPW